MAAAPDTMHATCIALGGRGALLCGPSGSGKSDLALRCISLAPSPLLPEAARLVADDRVALRSDGPRLIAFAPAAIAGQIEVRGVGIVSVAAVETAEVGLIVDLSGGGGIERFPLRWPTRELLGVSLPIVRLHPFEASAAQKVLLILSSVGVAGLP